MCPHKESGFTLVELLIAMAISGIVLGAAVNTFLAQRWSYALQEHVTAMTQGTRAALEMVTREVRMAGYNPARTSFDGITYDPTQVQIRADLNGDGDTADTNETIAYVYNPATQQLMRETDGSSQPIADHIQAFAFDYVDGAGTATPDPRYAANGGYRTYRLTSLVTPTNLALQ